MIWEQYIDFAWHALAPSFLTAKHDSVLFVTFLNQKSLLMHP